MHLESIYIIPKHEMPHTVLHRGSCLDLIYVGLNNITV
jgi:hypothetical protein